MMKTIYVIDDDEGILAGFEVLLADEGYKVVTSPNIQPLLRISKNECPDLILLDVLLSGADGRDVCRKLKSQELTKEIPIIMVSAHPKAGMETAQFGADDFIAKPFEMDDLLQKIKKYI